MKNNQADLLSSDSDLLIARKALEVDNPIKTSPSPFKPYTDGIQHESGLFENLPLPKYDLEEICFLLD